VAILCESSTVICGPPPRACHEILVATLRTMHFPHGPRGVVPQSGDLVNDFTLGAASMSSFNPDGANASRSGNDARRRNRRHVVGSFKPLAADERHADADAGGHDVMASLRWCQASSSRRSCPGLASRETNRNKPSFTTTTTSTMSVNGLGDRCGCMIRERREHDPQRRPSNIAATMARQSVGLAVA